jgi:hypothetical protein
MRSFLISVYSTCTNHFICTFCWRSGCSGSGIYKLFTLAKVVDIFSTPHVTLIYKMELYEMNACRLHSFAIKINNFKGTQSLNNLSIILWSHFNFHVVSIFVVTEISRDTQIYTLLRILKCTSFKVMKSNFFDNFFFFANAEHLTHENNFIERI